MLVAKPSATEKKSPWATLPPVEKVPLVQINPQFQQQPAPRFSQRESYGYDSMPPPLAKEIAPDDFNRSWRDDRGSRPELFNSQSGRYEPVNDTRRGSVRDNSFRQQPALLQRPSQDGPAEPSAAFQTSRASADMPTWGRRRNSSNVSGGNMRRMSFDRRAPDMPSGPMNIERRESQSINGFDPSESGAARQAPSVQALSPNVANVHPASPYGSVASAATNDQATPIAAPPPEDPVEVQKRLMADKIERARLKKQQEQEAERKAEAERKERIAKKLAAMGPPVDSKPKAKDPSPSRSSEQRSPLKEKAVPASVQSPPKPPVPTADGEVAQYGMMKVHQPHPIKKPSTTDATKGAKPAESASHLPSVKLPSEVRGSSSAGQQPAQSFDVVGRDKESTRQPFEASRNSTQQPERAAPSGPTPQGPPAPWSSAAAPPPRPWTSQVWGPPPTRDRALGNGTFDSSYDGSQPRPGTQQQLPNQTTASMTPIGSGLGQAPAISQAPSHQSVPMPVQPGPPSRPGPIAPPVAKSWGNFEAEIRRDDHDVAAKAQQNRERRGEAFRPELRETYKSRGGQAQSTLHNIIAGNVALPESMTKKDDAVKPAHEGSPQQSLGQGTPLQQSTNTRASRFFPRPTEITTQVPVRMASSKADSPPPPPETETHPAFSGSISHPLVRLPKPSPVVRLPPSAVGNDASAESVSMPSRGQPLGARPLAMNPEWQARFNKLLEKPGSAPMPTSSSRTASTTLTAASTKPGALAPAALSKASLDVRGKAGPATVSLPSAPQTKVFANDRGRNIITRKGAEALFEDREFGSLPTVKLAKVPHLASGEPAVSPPKDEPPRFKRMVENPFTIRRLEAFDIEKNAKDIDVIIRISSMRNPITKSMPRRRRGGPKNNSPFKSKHSNTSNGPSTGALKERPRKPPQQGQADRPTSSPRPSSTNANAWSNNNRNTPAQQQTTWARRAAAPVH